MDYKVTLSIDGMGIVFFSAKTMEYVDNNSDFLNNEFNSSDDITRHIQQCDITGFCTGSSGDFNLHFFNGYPNEDILKKFPITAKLGLDVRGGAVQFCDMFWLSRWNTNFPQEQIIQIEDGYYNMTVCTCRPNSGDWGDNQTIYIYFEKTDELPNITRKGIPYLYREL